MARYIVKQDYVSHAGNYKAGTVLELDDDFAAWLNRDSHDGFELIVDEPVPVDPPQLEVEPESETRTFEQPPQNRMVSKSRRRRK